MSKMTTRYTIRKNPSKGIRSCLVFDDLGRNVGVVTGASKQQVHTCNNQCLSFSLFSQVSDEAARQNVRHKKPIPVTKKSALLERAITVRGIPTEVPELMLCVLSCV